MVDNLLVTKIEHSEEDVAAKIRHMIEKDTFTKIEPFEKDVVVENPSHN